MSDQTTPMTVSARDLAATLRAVARFTAKPSDDLPILECIRLDATGSHFNAAATNRYAAAHVRLTATGDLPTMLLNHRQAKFVVSFLEHAAVVRNFDPTVEVRRHRVINVVCKDMLELTIGNGMQLRVPIEAPDGYPPIDKIYVRAEDLPVGLDAPVGIDLQWTSLFALAAKDFKGIVQWHFAGPRKAVRIQIGDMFTGIIMPIRLESPAPLIQIGGDPA